MRTQPGFNLRQICGENIIVAEGEQNIDFSNIISMNESAAFLWTSVQKLASFTVNDMICILTKEYDIDADTARHDCEILAATWAKCQIVEGEDVPQVSLPNAATVSHDTTSTIEPTIKPLPKKKHGLLGRLFGKNTKI